MKYPEKFVVRFWSNIKKSKGCWVWTGYVMKAGYGLLQCRAVSDQPLLAHRVSWELAHGPILGGLHVLHSCDNPPCVRASHLFLGTQADNNADRDRKGRVASGDKNGARTRPELNPFIRNHGSGLRGERHPMARLSEKDVKGIRRGFLDGKTKAELASEYGISQTHAGRIVKNRSW